MTYNSYIKRHTAGRSDEGLSLLKLGVQVAVVVVTIAVPEVAGAMAIVAALGLAARALGSLFAMLKPATGRRRVLA